MIELKARKYWNSQREGFKQSLEYIQGRMKGLIKHTGIHTYASEP